MLGELAEDCNASILMLTESHLTSEVWDAEIHIEGFEVHRTDRIGFRNGGVIIYVKSMLNLGFRVALSIHKTKWTYLCLKVRGLI